jgi:hypothetical protein
MEEEKDIIRLDFIGATRVESATSLNYGVYMLMQAFYFFVNSFEMITLDTFFIWVFHLFKT